MGKYSKMDKGAKDKLARSSGENGGQDAQNVLTIRVWGIKTETCLQIIVLLCLDCSNLYCQIAVLSEVL
jgi:hypothetical protein